MPSGSVAEKGSLMPDLKPGQLFNDRYRVLHQIGRGGMGAVYLVEDKDATDFIFALKVLNPEVLRSDEVRARFRNEISASHRINHPNVIKAFDYFDQDNFFAYTMEYVDGGDIASLMRTRRLTLKESVSFIKQIAAGLSAIHAESIIHRDLKPENALLTRTGLVKIVDFGVARLDSSSTITLEGLMVGTPAYIAPEYIETGEVDHRGDIYALGILSYQMIAGILPFRSKDRMQMMAERFQREVDDLAKAAPHCPPDLVNIVERMARRKVSSRYQTANEIVLDLELVEVSPQLLDANPTDVPNTIGITPGGTSILARLTQSFKKSK